MGVGRAAVAVDSGVAGMRGRPGRFLSLDLLRGLTIGFMILVNNQGSGSAYWPLKHAAWNGFTPTDLVFPTFLFLVGISTVLSTEARLAKGATKQSLFFHAVRRAVILFLLGLLVNSFPQFDLHTLRIYGVLPRIAICYFAVATLYLVSPNWKKAAVLLAVALGLYWVLMRFVPVPGYGIPTHDVPLLDRDGNLVAWLDRKIFAPSHLYEKVRDPEGLISTLPALGTALMGMLTGIWLRTGRSMAEKARGIAIAGISGVIAGGVWNLWFPINKKLWTSSYVLFAGGLSLLLLALSMWIVDLRRKGEGETGRQAWWSTVLLVFGLNAIAAYVFSELLSSALSSIFVALHVDAQRRPYGQIHALIPDAAVASLLYSLGFVAVCWLAMYGLYRRRIFIKI